MRLPVYNTPQVFDCSHEDLETYTIPYSLEDQRQTGRKIDVSFQGVLRPEQTPAAQALLEHHSLK